MPDPKPEPTPIEELPIRPSAPGVVAGVGLEVPRAKPIEEQTVLNQGQGRPQVINPAQQFTVKK